jgi:endonuclease-3
MQRPPTSPAANRKRLQRIAQALEAAMPEAKIELSHRSPWELLVATILSAQCTDQRVNQVTPALFTRYKTPSELAKARVPDVEAIIRSTGFFKSKAKNIVACSQVLTERFGQRVPERMDDLVTLPGVGRKTANVLLGQAFGQPAVVVDTHVKRVANRLDLTRSRDPVQIEQDLQQLLPSSQWTSVSQRLLLHGRYICLARRPLCGRCSIYDDCYAREKLPR